jgi:hypothetical protein
MKRIGYALMLVWVIGCGGSGGAGGGGNPTPTPTPTPVATPTPLPLSRLKAFNPPSKQRSPQDHVLDSLDVCVSNTASVTWKTFKVERGQSDGTFTTVQEWVLSVVPTNTAKFTRDSDGDICAQVFTHSGVLETIEGVPMPYRITLNGVAIPGVEFFTWLAP